VLPAARRRQDARGPRGAGPVRRHEFLGINSMSSSTVQAESPPIPGRSRAAAYAYAGVAAAAMVCTLPGRTHGLGLITEPLLADLALDRVPMAAINFWGTLIGATFCFPVGWVIDRIGTRWVLAGHLLALGAVC